MRSVTFVSRLSLSISGDVAQVLVLGLILVINDVHYPDQHGLCLGDVTGDGDHELVVGTDGGELLVFKGAGGEVWRRGQDLGFITAVGEFIMIDNIIQVMFYRNVEGMGDLLNIGHTVVVVVSGCGWLNILDLYNDTDMDTMEGEIKYVDCQ